MKGMVAISLRNVISGVRDTWNRQYEHYKSSEKIGHPTKKAVGLIRKDLAALDLETCTVADVDAAIGTTGWAELKCEICDLDRPFIIRFGDEPEYEARWVDVCPSCIAKGLTLTSQDRE